jgi:4-hydroxyphenylpyruvate dioxygenase
MLKRRRYKVELMKRGISSLSFSGPLEKKIEAAARAGFDGIEVFREDLVDFDGKPADVARLARSARIDILSLQSLRDFEARPAKDRDWSRRRALRFLDLAGEIGAPLLVVCANTRADTLDDEARAAEDLAWLADEAKGRGLRIGYEALSTSQVVRTYAQAWRIVKRADRENLGLIVGAVHTLVMRESFAALSEIPAERLFMVHMADAPRMNMDARLLTRHFRVFPGQGEQPVGALYAQLRKIGYAAPLSLEIFNDQVRAMPPNTVADDGIRSIRLLEEAAYHTADGPGIDDIAFVEIACSGADAARLKAMLTALGFVHTHSHNTMNVALYRQGGVDIVVNEQKNCVAASYGLLHGLSVFALAFSVRNLPALLERVVAHRGGEVHYHGGPIGPRIPAIRGIGGSFLYLLDASVARDDYYAKDFHPVATAPAAGNLARIDHLSQAVPLQEFLSSVLYYRALFGFDCAEQIDLIDPHGTVRNRNMHTPNGRVWMSLNSSLSPNSTTQRFLNQAAGAGFQHFGFECPDVFAYADRLDPSVALAISDNYYDDLLLRFDIEPELVARMRGRNILYDEDASGRYFQIYTRDINGLFFEAVQRDGYKGFGAGNAPVRMAAQARAYDQALDFAV